MGEPGSRLRVGDWRVLFEIDHSQRHLRVRRVMPRHEGYDGEAPTAKQWLSPTACWRSCRFDEYEELREALAEAADAAAMRRVRDNPDEEDVPVAFARRMWNGESPQGNRIWIAAWRGERGMVQN